MINQIDEICTENRGASPLENNKKSRLNSTRHSTIQGSIKYDAIK